MKCLSVAFLLIFLFPDTTATSGYRCSSVNKKCAGDDQCCNPTSFFRTCCPNEGSCCTNGPYTKCCGPLDNCCNDPDYKYTTCCPKNYQCCGAGRYGRLRNSCCYKIPVWLWVIIAVALALILLMLLLTLVECILEERGHSTDFGVSYYGAGDDYPPSTSYGTYNYNNGDLYNEPRYTPPPNYSRTPPPNYPPPSTSVPQTPPNNPTTTPPNNTPTTRQNTVSLLSASNEIAGDSGTVLPPAAENSNVSNGSNSERTQTDSNTDNNIIDRDEAVPSGSQTSLGTDSTSGFWRGFLRRTLDRGRSQQSDDVMSATRSVPDMTVDSGIVSESDSEDSTFHCTSWEDEEIENGKQVVYELNPRVPRLMELCTNDESASNPTVSPPRASSVLDPRKRRHRHD